VNDGKGLGPSFTNGHFEEPIMRSFVSLLAASAAFAIVILNPAALALTRRQRDFVEKRNNSFGKRGYDLRQAMEERPEKLNTIARQ
jgi:hypothetical protein